MQDTLEEDGGAGYPAGRSAWNARNVNSCTAPPLLHRPSNPLGEGGMRESLCRILAQKSAHQTKLRLADLS